MLKVLIGDVWWGVVLSCLVGQGLSWLGDAKSCVVGCSIAKSCTAR